MSAFNGGAEPSSKSRKQSPNHCHLYNQSLLHQVTTATSLVHTFLSANDFLLLPSQTLTLESLLLSVSAAISPLISSPPPSPPPHRQCWFRRFLSTAAADWHHALFMSEQSFFALLAELSPLLSAAVPTTPSPPPSTAWHYLVVSIKFSRENVELFCYLCWMIWYERNRLVHGGNSDVSVSATMEKASALLEEFRLVNEREKPAKLGRQEIWKAPPFGCFKLNTDGGLDPSSGCRGVSGLIRDDKGCLVGDFTKFIPGLTLATELWALKFGLEFDFSMGTTPVFVESDCLEAVILVNNVEDSWSENEHLLQV